MKIAELKQICSRPDVVEVGIFACALLSLLIILLVIFLCLYTFYSFPGVGCNLCRPEVVGVFEIIQEHCACPKALVSET